jgi:hypothetical protein
MVMRKKLAQFVRHQTLISLRRAAIDDRAIQGFILGYSDSLVLLQYEYDFNLDGLMILRAADISEITCTKTEKFQKKLLANEGLLSHVPAPSDCAVDLRNWRSAIVSLSQTYPLLILECEAQEEPDFAIGRILKAAPDKVKIHYFSGAATWRKKPVKFRYQDITSCRANANYINVYQRYFERNES